MASRRADSPRRLVPVFGDQLDPDARLIRSLTADDTVLMMEVAAESEHVASHVQRTVLFLSAMRHFAAELRSRGLDVRYVELDDPANTGTFAGEIRRAIKAVKPDRMVCIEPGEWRVLEILEHAAEEAGIELEVVPDEHFLTSREEFFEWAEGRKSLTMEYFYREQRRKTGYLMKGPSGDEPDGGEWNLDKANRETFSRSGPDPSPKPPKAFDMDDITQAVVKSVRKDLPDLPGTLDDDAEFRWPVTRQEALAALDDFIKHRLEHFGPYEDAMWAGEPVLYHSVLSSSLNLKLLNPRECCERAIAAYTTGKAPLQSVEGFVRQIIGWREFIRGIYWFEGSQYGQRNAMKAQGKLPDFYWTGETDMACLRECIGQVLQTGHNHHIPRLMVMGNFALIGGVHPKAISDWFLGMFVDGIDWVTLPNTLGMVMHADGRDGLGKGVTGVVGTKPYAASGQYIQRMSNYCRECRYDPGVKTGEDACPFSVFHWDFLISHREHFADNQRMAMILKNIDRMKKDELTQITVDARALRKRFGIARAGK